MLPLYLNNLSFLEKQEKILNISKDIKNELEDFNLEIKENLDLIISEFWGLRLKVSNIDKIKMEEEELFYFILVIQNYFIKLNWFLKIFKNMESYLEENEFKKIEVEIENLIDLIISKIETPIEDIFLDLNKSNKFIQEIAKNKNIDINKLTYDFFNKIPLSNSLF